MGLLNHFFSSTEAIAREIEADDEAIIEHWKDYLETIPKKKDALGNLPEDHESLKVLLKLELADIIDEEKEESELIKDLEIIEHSEKIKKVQRLRQRLGDVATKYMHVYGLLRHLHEVLKTQMHLVEKLEGESKVNMIVHLKLQFELEIEILNQIKRIKTFHELFVALVKGEHMKEHIISHMDAGEKKLLIRMQEEMSRIFSDELKEGITYEWAITVFNAIEDKIQKAYEDGILDGQLNINFQFVNSPDFVILARETIASIRKRHASDQMVKVFVHLFREWYNYEMD